MKQKCIKCGQEYIYDDDGHKALTTDGCIKCGNKIGWSYPQ